MPHIAKLFTNGRSQAVRLPMAYRFDAKEVFIRPDPATGDVIASRKSPDWDGFLAAIEGGAVPTDFLDPADRGACVGCGGGAGGERPGVWVGARVGG